MAFEYIKSVAEKIFNVKIFRNSLPFGTIIQNDLKRYFKNYEFKVIFDVGANAGQSALEYVKVFPKSDIYCFEPVDKTFSELQKKVNIYPNIHPYNLAFGDKATTLEISINDNSCVNSFKDITTAKNSQSISIITLTEFVAQKKIKRINFLKIDTEGFDLNVLVGSQNLLQKQTIDIIQVECAFNESNVQVNIIEFINYLKKFNYALFGIYDQQPSWSGDPWLFFGNAIFVRKNILIA